MNFASSRMLAASGVALLLLSAGCTSDDHYYVQESWMDTRALSVADLDGKGGLDVISANAIYGHGAPHQGFLVSRLQDAAPGSFLNPLRTDTSPDPAAMVVADMNGDGHLDVVLAHEEIEGSALGSSCVTVCYQSATEPGRFPTQTRLDLGGRNSLDLCVADLGSGRMDIIVAAEGGTDLLLLRQTAPGTFAAPESLELGAEPKAVAAGNLTGSGVDLVAGTATGLQVLMHGATPGTFQAGVKYETHRMPASIKLADVNGDGNLDIVAANWELDSDVSVLLQDGATGAFLAPVNVPTWGDYAASVAVGKLASDAQPSLLVAHYGAPGYSGGVSVLRPDPQQPGRFLEPERYQGYTGPRSIALGDLNGDGLLDMVVADGGPLVRFQDAGQPGFFEAPVGLKQ